MASDEEVSSPSSLLYPYTREREGEEEEEEDIIFCSEENISEASIYINQELEVLGFNSILTTDTDNQPNIVKMLNTTYDVLQQYRGSLQKRDHINMSLQRIRSDLTLQSETTNRLKVELEERERKLIQYKEKERQVLARNRSLSLQLKTQEEECQRLKHRMTQKELQYEHELRKKEREYQRLNDRLGQLVLDKSQEKKLGIKMLNTLQQQSRSGKRDGTDKGEKVYKLVISHYEEKQKELVLENSSLRDSLCNMEKELVTLLNQQYLNNIINSPSSSQLKERSLESRETGEEGLLDSGHYQMPFDIVRQDIEENLRDKYKRLREYIGSLKEGHASSDHTHSPDNVQYDKDIEELEKKLADYRDIINQQEILLEKQLIEESISGPGLGFLNESRYLKKEEMLDLREEKNKHREDYLKREEERLNVIAKQLDRERQNFEDKRTQFLTQQLDNSVFATPSKPSSSDLDSFFVGLISTPFTASRDTYNSRSTSRRFNRPFMTPSTYNKPSLLSHNSPSLRSSSKATTCTTATTSSNLSRSVFPSPPPLPSLNGGGDIDLKQNISLTSDDGLEVLNE